jgi:hypothetical protein
MPVVHRLKLSRSVVFTCELEIHGSQRGEAVQQIQSSPIDISYKHNSNNFINLFVDI